MSDVSNGSRPNPTRKNVVRRRTLFGCCAGLAATLFAPASMVPFLGSPAAYADTQTMSPQDAHNAAQAGDILLLDIRSPEEWQDTGIPASGHPVSMHVPGFLEKLAKLNGGDRSKPVALICARGNRSAFLKTELEKRGFTRVIDVSEGMVGGQSGAGWIARDLPIAKVKEISAE